MGRFESGGASLHSNNETDPVSLFARSPGLAADAVDSVITIPTFKRPAHLLETLRSLADQQTARRFAVIVMENETEERAGAKAAAPLFEDGLLAGLVIIAHRRGNCAAYNAGWHAALETFPNFRYLLVIDDDETAAPGWLEAMCSAAETLEADIVGGPQLPVFAEGTADRFKDHPVFKPPYERSGRVPGLYSSGNLLLRRRVLEAMEQPFLDLKFNFMGGGDSDFLSRAAVKGYRLAWCAEAPVHETVPARRLEADWIRARSLRNGVISTLVEKKKRASERLGALHVLARSLALLTLAPLRGLGHLVATGSLSSAMYPIYVGLGRVLAEIGYANEQYREPDKN